MRAIEIGTVRVVQAPESTRVDEAARLMRRQQTGCVVVTRDVGGRRQPIGIATDRDLALRVVAAAREAAELTLAQVQSSPLVTCAHDATLAEVVALMRGNGVRRLPLLDRDGALAGIVCADDVLLALSELAAQLTEVLQVESGTGRAFA